MEDSSQLRPELCSIILELRRSIDNGFPKFLRNPYQGSVVSLKRDARMMDEEEEEVDSNAGSSMPRVLRNRRSGN